MATRKMAFGGMGKKMAGVAKAAAGKAAEAGKAKEAQKSAMVDKLKSAMATRQSADSGKVQAMKAQADAAKARQVAKAPAAKPAMPARPMGGGMGARPTGGTSGGMGGGMGARPAPKGDSFEKVKAAYANENNRINASKAAGTYKAPEVRGMLGGGGGPPSRPMGGGMGARPMARPTERIPRPAGTVSPNAAKMVGKTFGGMGMKKGGKARGR